MRRKLQHAIADAKYFNIKSIYPIKKFLNCLYKHLFPFTTIKAILFAIYN